MAYIGQGIKQGTFKVLDTSGNTYNGSNTTFSLGTQVGAGAVYFTNAAEEFIKTLKAQMLRYGLIWFVDQVALWQVHRHFSENNLGLRFQEMPFKYIDWEFGSDGVIWTGKGARKVQANYLEERARAS